MRAIFIHFYLQVDQAILKNGYPSTFISSAEIVEVPPFEPRFVHLESGDKFDQEYQILEELGKGWYSKHSNYFTLFRI